MAELRPATKSVLKRVGLRIRELRLERGLTQEKAAERVRMLVSNYARIEQGRQNVTVDTLVRIARVLRVEVPELFVRPEARFARPGRPRKSVSS